MDILFFAAIAAFVFYKLVRQFGKIDDEERKQIDEKIAKQRQQFMEAQREAAKRAQEAQKNSSSFGQNFTQNSADNSQKEPRLIGASSTSRWFKGFKQEKKSEEKIQSDVVQVEVKKEEENFLQNLDESSKQGLEAILQRCKISAQFITKGAEVAYEEILKSFAAADTARLRPFLSDKIFQAFEAAINARKSEEKTLTTNLISIEKSEIVSAAMLENVASVAVRLVSKQINYISSKEGEILEGRKDQIAEITDTWTFRRDLASTNPNWVLAATS